MNSFNRTPQIDSKAVIRLKTASKGMGALVSGVGCLVLLGWAFDIAELKSILPGWASMKSMTAMLFILAGLALVIRAGDQSQRIAQLCALIIFSISALTLGEYIFHVDFGIDQMLFREPATGVLFPGRMAPATALCFLLVGLYFLFETNPSLDRHKNALVIAALAISMLALIGYLYGVSSLYQIGAHTSMALHTGLSFVLLAVGLVLARPEQGLMQTILADTAGGRVLRRFLPVAFGFPIILGWLGLLGQQAGWYDTAFGLAIMVISVITTLTISLWINAQQLTQADLKRQETYNNLLESEKRFRTTIESMTEGYQLVGFDWHHIFVNDSALKNTQLSREQLLGRTLMECFPGIENSAMFAAFRECMEARTTRQILTQYEFPNGARGWFNINVQPVPDGILILSNDVTEHKLAELALAEREKQLSRLFEILPVGISIHDSQRKMTYSNPALKKILHLSEQSLQHEAYKKRKYVNSDGAPILAENMASALAFRENRQIDAVETGIVTEDGSTIWTSVSAVPMDIQDWRLVLVTVDITERKRVEEALLQERKLLRTLVDNIPSEVYVKDLDRRFLLVNELVMSALGAHSMDDIIGKRDEDFLPADVAQRFADEENELIRTGQSIINDEHTPPHKAGPPQWFLRTKLPLRNTHGTIIGLAGFGTDITKRKLAEEEVVQLNIDLERKVAQRTAELAKANQQLQQLAIVDELTGLYNRRGFMLLAEAQLLLAKRTRHNLLIFYADLDGLKQINDQLGHAAGDQAIRSAAQALEKTFRASDIKARLGGDEFIVLAVEAAGHDIPILLSRLQKTLGQNQQSMSIGTINVEIHNDISLESLMASADKAMYEVKLKKPQRYKR